MKYEIAASTQTVQSLRSKETQLCQYHSEYHGQGGGNSKLLRYGNVNTKTFNTYSRFIVNFECCICKQGK